MFNCMFNFYVHIQTPQCLGEGEVSAGGEGALLHDSHAEVVAKRAFQLYLIDQIRGVSSHTYFVTILFKALT